MGQRSHEPARRRPDHQPNISLFLYCRNYERATAGLGPVAVGTITDYVLGDASAIGAAIAATCVTAGMVGLLLFRSGFATYAATRAAAAEWREGTTVPAEPTVAEGQVANAH